jgi:hypothetical protein
MSERPTTARSLLTWLVLAAALAVLAWQVHNSGTRRLLPPEDFCEYWAAGRLNATGGNPYSPAQLLELQSQDTVGWTGEDAVLMYNPPWTLPFVMPFGLLPFAHAQLLWLLLNLLIVAGSADVVWRLYGGDPQQRWWAWGLAVVFMPTVIVLRMGQIPPLALLGLVGFLYWQRRGCDLIAGAFLMLTAIKPQLVYLVGVAVLLWSAEQRRWRVLAGGVTSLAICTGVAWLVNPDVIGQWRQLLADKAPAEWVTTTFGSLLRSGLGDDLRGELGPNERLLQYIAPALGLAWLGWYWTRRRHAWDWSEQLPLLVLVSVITTFFAWMGDEVVLLPAVIQAAVWVARSGDRSLMITAGGLYLMGNVVIFAFNAVTQNQLVHLWVAPALLAGYLVLRNQCVSRSVRRA